MRKIMAATAIALGLAFLPASPALAKPTPTSGVHFTQGGTPVCRLNADTTVDCTAELAGLGEGDIVITTSVGGSAVYQCQNKGGNLAPGQNKVLVGPEVNSVLLPGDEIENGRATITGFTEDPLVAPPTVSGRAAGCPNGNWTGINPVLSITSVTFKATQGGVLLFSCSATGSNLRAGSLQLVCSGGVAR
jgi:hypothetical protein